MTMNRTMEILLVEDNLVHARATIGMLRRRRFKHRVTLMRDGLEVMEFLHQQGKFVHAPRPDLILLDLFLPKMDGRRVLGELKSDITLRTIPVVLLTTSAEHESVVRRERLPVDGYLAKPVTNDRFWAVVRRLKSFWTTDVLMPQAV